ncbi:hypothetical protein N7452_000345 [Penicillium brevicompactum]|uniref:Methyltransferase domain-containing protein n=1 Tax=Penicillium brevicompactum TaxID=5074 RepID=A0A9W9UQT7_PENBR|nr:hypothetical protein N7452_000345 [Penicillium brevicompactum]
MSDPADGGVDFALYRYTPSIPAAAIFGVVFIGLSIWHLIRLIKHRSYFFVPFLIGLLLECAGYFARIFSHFDTKALGPYIVQTMLILVAPPLFAASIYMTLGRIIVKLDAEEMSLVPIKYLTKVFVVGDVISFLLQCGGGGYMAAGTLSAMNIGENIVIGGLAIQLLFFGFFVIVSAVFHWCVKKRTGYSNLPPRTISQSVRTKMTWESVMWALYIACLLILTSTSPEHLCTMTTIQDMLAAEPSKNSQPTQYVDTVEAYNKWAEVYDTDGNFLQRLDTIEMRSLLPHFLDRVSTLQDKVETTAARSSIIDLGCGTGRNTVQLLDALSARKNDTFNLIGLDASPGMLDVARTALNEHATKQTSPQPVSLDILDILQTASSSQLPPSIGAGASGVISTLVLEHIPLAQFFAVASMIMRPGAYLLVTNMHEEMGMQSQAGFTDPESGVKIRPTSYCHAVPDVLKAAQEAGFSVANIGENDVTSNCEEGVIIRGVDEELRHVLGARAGKWVGVKVWFGICFRKASE